MKTTQKAVVENVKPKWWANRKLQAAAGIVLVVILVLLYLLVLKPEPKRQITSGRKCSSDVLKNSSKVLTPPKQRKLKKIVEKVKKIDGHEQDLNCLYIILVYSINFEESKKAHEYLEKFEKLYNPKSGVSPLLGNKAKTLTELKKELEFFETLTKQLEKNTLGAPSGPPKE